MFPFNTRKGQRGQTIILTTMTLMVSFGLLGFVVDIGWAYFKRTSARTAAEAAATAAVVYASTAPNWTCGTTVACATTSTACPASPTTPPSDALQSGCLYAKQNGFRT